MKQQGKIWLNSKKQEIPTYAISPVLRLEEKHSQKIAALAVTAEKHLQSVVDAMFTAYAELEEAKLAEAKMKNNKGRDIDSAMTINSFDSGINIKITKPSSLKFDTYTLGLITQKVQEYLESLNANSDTAIFLKNLLNDLLRKSDGQIDQTNLSTLRKHVAEIKGNETLAKKAKPLFEAVDLFDKASRVKTGNSMIYVDVPDETGKRRVALKITDLI
jgi:hypothetical protein